ncbi:MAG: hypothetical protein EU532_11455 [Promethearchaeota archaeon]|nr:MAG: hypothetical protein EU532_11455 [Candidatus Lokiarchaeota archaeon]
MSKLNVKRVIIFKHGISYFILEGKQRGSDTFELEFKIDEMNDILKSLFVLDTSEKGYISSISYDAALDTAQLLKTIMLNIPDNNSFSSLITQIKGANITLTIGSSQTISGTIMGIELLEKFVKDEKITEKLLALLKNDGVITKVPFSEISSFEILNEDLQKDLKFFLDTVIAGKKKDSKKIIINCESGGDNSVERSIIVSYIRESPVWKTSYRLIMSKQQAQDKKCLLSGWALIENTTNQDWENIELSLVAGMPVSFIYDFYRPIYIQRTIIEPPKVLSARPTEIEEGLEMEAFEEYKMKDEAFAEAPMMMKEAKKRAARPPPAPAGAARASTTLGFAADMDDSTLLDKVKSQTATQTKELGELFEYNISNPVTIKRKHSALVPILTEQIKAEKILLYNKHENDKNPNACLEITNNSGLVLERGPVTFIYDNNLAGEAIIPFLNRDDIRLLNYAVEQAVIINHEDFSQNLDVHRISIGGSYCYEYYYTNLRTVYRIKNKTDEEKILYLDHPKQYGYKITESPVEPEETANYWRFKLTLKPKDAVEFIIKERKENYSSYYIYNYTKDDLLKRVAFYVQQKFINEKLESQLKEVGELIGRKNDLSLKKSKLEDERYQMTDEQTRLRENISVLGNTSQENTLKEKYVKKLSVQEERFETISKEIKELEQELTTLDKKIEEKIEKLKIH